MAGQCSEHVGFKHLPEIEGVPEGAHLGVQFEEREGEGAEERFLALRVSFRFSPGPVGHLRYALTSRRWADYRSHRQADEKRLLRAAIPYLRQELADVRGGRPPREGFLHV